MKLLALLLLEFMKVFIVVYFFPSLNSSIWLHCNPLTPYSGFLRYVYCWLIIFLLYLVNKVSSLLFLNPLSSLSSFCRIITCKDLRWFLKSVRWNYFAGKIVLNLACLFSNLSDGIKSASLFLVFSLKVGLISISWRYFFWSVNKFLPKGLIF